MADSPCGNPSTSYWMGVLFFPMTGPRRAHIDSRFLSLMAMFVFPLVYYGTYQPMQAGLRNRCLSTVSPKSASQCKEISRLMKYEGRGIVLDLLEEKMGTSHDKKIVQPSCRKCGSNDTRPSHLRLWEWPLLWLVIPFRCRACRRRFRTLRILRPKGHERN